MNDQRTHLKIKIKNLADEARTIRTEENKTHGMAKWKLQHHRKTVVRDAARCSQIAYQWIRGTDWWSCASVEIVGFSMPQLWHDWPEITRMVKKYGSAEAIQALPSREDATKTFEARTTFSPVYYEASEEPVRMANQ